MKRIAEAAAAQLARRPGTDEPITAEEMVRVLARIARTGPPASAGAAERADGPVGDRARRGPRTSPQRR